MKYEFEHHGVPFSVAAVEQAPEKWRWTLHATKVFGSLNRIEGGQVVGTRAEGVATARKAIEKLGDAQFVQAAGGAAYRSTRQPRRLR